MFQRSASARDEKPKASCKSGGGRHGRGSILLFAVVFAAALRPDQPAQAYLDPGSGAILLQMLLGGVAGILVILKLYWHRLTTFLRGNRKPSQAIDQPPRK